MGSLAALAANLSASLAALAASFSCSLAALAACFSCSLAAFSASLLFLTASIGTGTGAGTGTGTSARGDDAFTSEIRVANRSSVDDTSTAFGAFLGLPRFLDPASLSVSLEPEPSFLGRPRLLSGIAKWSRLNVTLNLATSASTSSSVIFNFCITFAYATGARPFGSLKSTPAVNAVMRSSMLPQSGFPDAFLSHCFLHPEQYPDDTSFVHWLSRPWFCFRPPQHPANTAPLNGNANFTFEEIFFSTGFFAFFSITLPPPHINTTLPILLFASDAEKPYTRAHVSIASKCTSSTSRIITLSHIEIILIITPSNTFYITISSPNTFQFFFLHTPFLITI